MEGVGDDLADVLGLHEFVGRGPGDGVEVGEATGEGLGGAGPDVKDAESKEEPPQLTRSGGIHASDEVGGGLFPHPLEGRDLFGFQEVEVGDIAGEARRDQLMDHDLAAALDVHGTAGTPVFESAADLGGAGGILAAPDNAFAVGGLFTGNGRGALGTGLGKLEEGFGAGATFGYDADDGRNDFSGLLDDDAVADADILPTEFVLVVEGGAADGGTGEEDGFEFGDGGQGAGAADLDGDGLEKGLGLLGSVLVGHGPAWGLRGVPELLVVPELQVIELHDRAVGLVTKGASDGVELLDGLEDLLGRVGGPQPFRDWKAECAEPFQQVRLTGGHGGPRDLAEPVDDDEHGTAGHEARVELLEGSRGGVSGIRERFFARGNPFCVQLLECRGRHVDLAADLQYFREGGGFRRCEAEGKVTDCAEVGRDVVALGSVAAGGAEDKLSLLVAKGHGDAIDLGFNGPAQRDVSERFLDACEEGADLLGGIGVLQAHHGHGVGHLDETGDGSAADALGG